MERFRLGHETTGNLGGHAVTTGRLDAFKLRDDVIETYADYVTSFIKIADEGVAAKVRESLDAGDLWPEPWVQINPSYEVRADTDQLIDRGTFNRAIRSSFSTPDGDPWDFYTHQVEAFERASTGVPYVMTTGTGSGKSVTYIAPIIDHVLRTGTGQGIKAIIVYPMNALANSQVDALKEFLPGGYVLDAIDENGVLDKAKLTAPVTFARYTGQNGRHGDPDAEPQHRYWVSKGLNDAQLPDTWDRDWLIGFRDKGTLERTMLITVMPRMAAGHPLPLLLPMTSTPRQAAFLIAALSSLVCDYAIRFKGLRMYKYVVAQAPVPAPPAETDEVPWGGEGLLDFVVPRVAELSATTTSTAGFAEDCGLAGPYQWDDDRRPVLQAELDALMFHLYRLDRDQVEWVLSTFKNLRETEEKAPSKGGLGEYRTRQLVLTHFDSMQTRLQKVGPSAGPNS